MYTMLQYAPDNPYSCPVVSYELSWQEGWRWLSHSLVNNSATLVGKLPGTLYRLKVRAFTTNDYAPYSEVVEVRTNKQGRHFLDKGYSLFIYFLPKAYHRKRYGDGLTIHFSLLNQKKVS